MFSLVRAAARRKAAATAAFLLVFLVAGTAVAGSGIGGVFNLGRINSVNYVTTLTGAYASRLLQVTNTAATAAAVGAQIRASYGIPLQLVGSTTKPPMTVNSTVKVAKLNADLLDGKNSTDFVAGHGEIGGVDGGVNAELSGDLAFPGGSLTVFCPNIPSTQDWTVMVSNHTGGAVDLFIDNAGADPTYARLENDYAAPVTLQPVDSTTIRLSGSNVRMTIWLFNYGKSSLTCYLNAQWVITR